MRLTFLKDLSSSSFLFRTIIAVTVAGIFSVQPVYAQVPANNSPSDSTAKSHLKFWHRKARTADSVPSSKRIDAKVTGGILTVDGLVAKVDLNYDIHRSGYIYFFSPGVGTAVVSRVEMPGSTRVPGAIRGSSIAFTFEGHSFALENDDVLTISAQAVDAPLIKARKQKAKETHDIYVVLDANARALYRTPQVGFGDTRVAPYVFPLSDTQPKDTYAHMVQPPPMPASVLPRTKATAGGGTGGR
jgi:hypothetical protein